MPKRAFSSPGPDTPQGAPGSAEHEQAPVRPDDITPATGTPVARDGGTGSGTDRGPDAVTNTGSAPPAAAPEVAPPTRSTEDEADTVVVRTAQARPPVGPPAPPRPVGPPPVPGPPQPVGRPLGPPTGRPFTPPADPRSAADLDEGAILRPPAEVPASGWRRAVWSVSRGAVNPGPGTREQRRSELLTRIRRALPGAHFVSVLSLKGGVGKTTVAATLGLVMSENRGDRVVAVDANPYAGTLAERLTGDTQHSVRDLLAGLDGLVALPDVARFTSLVGRLQVVSSVQDPAAHVEFDRRGYEQVTAVLSRFYNIIVTDSGTGLLHSAMESTLSRAGTMVVVGAPTVDGASRASRTLDWLDAHGFAEAARRSVVVLSAVRSSPDVDSDRLRAHFAPRCRAIVEIPADPHLDTGGVIDAGRLRPATLDAFWELAALVADEFGSPPPQRGRPGPPPPSSL